MAGAGKLNEGARLQELLYESGDFATGTALHDQTLIECVQTEATLRGFPYRISEAVPELDFEKEQEITFERITSVLKEIPFKYNDSRNDAISMKPMVANFRELGR